MVTATKWPCVFRSKAIVDVNAKLYTQDPNVPFSAYQRTWRKQHCATINPYGSESCPYTEQECADAFYKTASESLILAKRSRVGLFKAFARYSGLVRSENKPLARYRMMERTDGHESGATDLRGGTPTGASDVRRVTGPQMEGGGARGVDATGPVGVRRTDHRPVRLGDMLRGNDPRPRTHPYGRDQGQAPADKHGDGPDRVQLSSPGITVGSDPQAPDPNVHQGGE